MPHQRAPWGHSILITITVVSTVLAVLLLSHQPLADAGNPNGNALNDRSGQIIAIPIAIKMGMEGIALIDKVNQTICIYQYQAHLPAHQRFTLLAARSFKYDVLLKDYNTAEPRSETVRELLMKNESSDSEADTPPDSIDQEQTFKQQGL